MSPQALAPKPKIFCIGFPKTGTMSLSAALTELGYKAAHYPIHDVIPGLYAGDYSPIDKYDAILNCGEWHFVEFEKRYPNARFVLTMREEDAWLESLRKHIERYPLPNPIDPGYYNRLATFGSVTFQEGVARTFYRAHATEVRRHFRGKSNFLELDVSDEDAYDSVCDFLGHARVNRPFPKRNVAATKAETKPSASHFKTPAPRRAGVERDVGGRGAFVSAELGMLMAMAG